jgi:Skp family chaperone for outer membrane proteins
MLTLMRIPMVCWSAWLLVAGPARAQEAPDAAVVELRETISKIVDTQALASRERTDWESRKAQMATLLELHARELALLDEELQQAGQSAGGHDEAKNAAEAELEQLRATRRIVAEAVSRNVPRALGLLKRFPEPLARETELEQSALATWKPGDEPRDALQAILGLVAKAEQFNRRISRSREVRDGREVEVLYLGLARAYYAGGSGNAGIGEPGAEEWSWTPRPELHGELQKAFATLDKRRPPELVELPLRIR